ncbi:MAG: hypothetical protein JWP11_1303 [Frankiales bacterium]|nr:hypothetical protein [Frankiales bacterium]
MTQGATPGADPFTALSEASLSLHEWFVSLVAAGFTDLQAMQLMAAVITAQGSS